MKTRFMEAMFSATQEGDEELAKQVSDDIESAKDDGQVDTDEVTYINLGSGKVLVYDKVNQEATISEDNGLNEEGDPDYSLIPVPDEDLEQFIHMQNDGITPNSNVRGEYEDFRDHMDSDYDEDPETAEEIAQHSFSVLTDNTAVLRIFSDQVYCERIFSEVIESEDTAKVGNLKVEKVDDDTIIVTDTESGDQAKVELDGPDMEVTELDQKEFRYSDDEDDEDEDYENEEDFEPLYVVGIAPDSMSVVDAQAYDNDDATELLQRLSGMGVQNLQIFDDPEEARSHAQELIEQQDADATEDPEEHNFSDRSLYVTRYYSTTTDYMMRLFSEEAEIDTNAIGDAIEDGEEVETDSETITPVDDSTAVVEDKETGEFTKATLNKEGDVSVTGISKDKAEELVKDVLVDEDSEEDLDEDDEDEDDEKTYSDYYEDDYVTDYMLRLYSDDEEDHPEQDKIEDALEDGKEVETEDEIITPVDDSTAVVEDKETGEFTKVTIDDEDMESEPIDEDEADDLTKDLVKEDTDEDEDEDKRFSCYGDYFDNGYGPSDYMIRLFSEEADDEDIHSAIEDGEQVETDDEIITPVDDSTAVIEDKETGEFTKAVSDGDGLDLEQIDEDEADDLMKDTEVDDRKFSCYGSGLDSGYGPTDYIMRLFSEEADDEDIHKAIEDGEQVETDDEIITPISKEAAVIEDKESGEFTKAVSDGDGLDLEQIDEDEADDLMKDIDVKEFSETPAILERIFAEAVQQQQAQPQQALPAGQQQLAPEYQPINPVQVQDQQQPQQVGVEAIEDKAIEAVNSINEAAQAAVEAIQQAKQAPAPGTEDDLQEASFSEYYDDYEIIDSYPLVNYLNFTNR